MKKYIIDTQNPEDIPRIKALLIQLGYDKFYDSRQSKFKCIAFGSLGWGLMKRNAEDTFYFRSRQRVIITLEEFYEKARNQI